MKRSTGRARRVDLSVRQLLHETAVAAQLTRWRELFRQHRVKFAHEEDVADAVRELLDHFRPRWEESRDAEVFRDVLKALREIRTPVTDGAATGPN